MAENMDGTWSIWFEGPPDLSVTVEAYAALKLAGVDAGDATREYIRRVTDTSYPLPGMRQVFTINQRYQGGFRASLGAPGVSSF